MNKTKILILYDYFDPAYKAGGPIRSLVNMVKLMEEKLDLYVLTSNQDHDGTVLNVEADRWVSYGKSSHVHYLSRANWRYSTIRKIIHELHPEVIYINGMFSLHFVVYPLKILKKRQNLEVVLAPRGMLQKGALKIKRGKKKLYLTALKYFVLNSHRIKWHATDLQEKRDIVDYSKGEKVIVAGNIPSFSKKDTHVAKSLFHFVSLSLLTVKKNYLAFIEALNKVKAEGKIVYHFYGPVSDQHYYEKMLQAASRTNSNIEIEYKGEVQPADVSDVLQKYKYYILPTLGENFGHSIFEAFNLGIPVIISDQTPWKSLKEKKAGWDVDLTDPNGLPNAIQEALSIDEESYRSYQRGARMIAEKYIEEHDFEKLYLDMLSV